MKEETKGQLAYGLLYIVVNLAIILPFIIGGYIFYKDTNTASNNIKICNNVQKLYKDDILFDNFYISCNDETIEIDKKLFTRVIEGKNYKITYNKNGGIYLVESNI